jgi:hypothetical protein
LLTGCSKETRYRDAVRYGRGRPVTGGGGGGDASEKAGLNVTEGDKTASRQNGKGREQEGSKAARQRQQESERARK